MTRPTFSILKNTEENTNLALKQLIAISIEDGTITKEDLIQIDNNKKLLISEEI